MHMEAATTNSGIYSTHALAWQPKFLQAICRLWEEAAMGHHEQRSTTNKIVITPWDTDTIVLYGGYVGMTLYIMHPAYPSLNVCCACSTCNFNTDVMQKIGTCTQTTGHD